MRLNFGYQLGLMATTFTLAIALVSCGDKTESPTATTEPPASTPAVQGEPLETTKEAKALEAGSYCYRTETPKVQAIAEFLVEPNGSATGTLDATITDKANDYFSSYQQNFAGMLEGETFDTAITTKIEGDVQNTQEEWTLNATLVTSDRDLTLKRVDCEEIIALKSATKEDPKPPAPAPADPKPQSNTPPSSSPAPTPPKATAPIQVQFASGTTEKTLSGNLNPGQTQVYLLNAKEGQDMFVKIVSNTGAANFDVEVDNGEVIESELGDYLDFTLPFSGQYIITTRATAPNTSYDITVRIK